MESKCNRFAYHRVCKEGNLIDKRNCRAPN
jgi:hypothetical protein